MAAYFWLKKEALTTSMSDLDGLSEAQAHAFLAGMRWQSEDHQVCPDCGVRDKHYFRCTRLQWSCKHCFKTFSVTSGTAFHGHKLKYHVLLKALFLFAMNQKGLSALALRRYLGVQYRTAYLLMHKIREAIMLNTEVKPLSGHVEIDGGHFSGKKRKPRKVAEKELPKLAKKYQHRDKVGPAENPFHENRRIIIVFRECDTRPLDKGGRPGAIRTITAICNAEDSQVVPLVEKYVKKGSKVYTDELPAYRRLQYIGFSHETVNHSREFSSDAGVNQNQAESYFSRLRRAFIGVFHRITPRYMLDYSCEMSWREDMRRTDLLGQVADLFYKVTNTPHSKDWRNYVRGNKREGELRTIPGL